MEKRKKTVQVPTLDFAGKATDVYDFRSNCSIGSRKPGRLYSRTDSQVMNEDQLPENRKEVDDQDQNCITVRGWHHETDNKDFSNGAES